MWTSRLRELLPAPSVHATRREVTLAVDITPLQMAARLRSKPGFIWLDGAATGHHLLFDPIAELTVTGSQATVARGGQWITFAASAFDLLVTALNLWRTNSGAMLAGYIGYELGPELESLALPPRGEGDLPDLHLGLYDFGLRYDSGGWRFWSSNAWRDVDVFDIPLEQTTTTVEGARSPGLLVSRPSEEEFKAAVARTVKRIYAGELFQTNLCRALEAPFDARLAWHLYQRMRAFSPANYGAFVDLGGGRAVASVSPELFLKVRGRKVESRPIKGTRPRGETEEEDRRLARELEQSEKDRAELAMIVDVVRNDLGRVCEAGSVKVERHAELMRLPTVHHTCSTVTGRLREDVNLADLVRAAFPPASISGAPKIRAMEVAIEEEGQRRGPAMGSIGWISLGGDAELSVAIRTAAIANGRIRYHAGGGITANSDPERELEETQHKARAFVQALRVTLL